MRLYWRLSDARVEHLLLEARAACSIMGDVHKQMVKQQCRELGPASRASWVGSQRDAFWGLEWSISGCWQMVGARSVAPGKLDAIENVVAHSVETSGPHYICLETAPKREALNFGSAERQFDGRVPAMSEWAGWQRQRARLFAHVRRLTEKQTVLLFCQITETASLHSPRTECGVGEEIEEK